MKPYEPEKLWQSTHQEVDTKDVEHGEGIRSVGGGGTNYEAKYLYALRKRAISRALKHVNKLSFSHVLEFGCGAGYWLEYFQKTWADRDFTYVGADISETAVERLAVKYPHQKFVCLSDTEFGWNQIGSQSPYQVVLAIDVLYHITDDVLWEDALNQLCSSVVDGGYFLFTDYGYEQVRERPGSVHVKHRPLQAYLDIFEAHGLSVEKVVPMFYFFNRIKYGPFKDHGAFTTLTWKLADRIGLFMMILFWVDCIALYFIRPLSTVSKKRVFLLRKSEL